MTCGARIISGEMHYARIPRAYWRERLRMARAAGLNAVSTYVFWNKHETIQGSFDFSGENDVAQYVRIAQEEGLHVLLRPGPYVCAEWDFGGLPAWLLADGPIAIRTADEAYMTPVRRWLRRLGEELAPLQSSHGGPIIAVQIENEYGAFGSDKHYLDLLRAALIEAGFAPPFFTIDQPGDLAAGSLPDVALAVTFAPGNPAHIFERVRSVRAGAPLLVGEYWAGWFDHWGEARERLDDEQQRADLQWMLDEGASVNIYMFHGGTNFGFWNGANSTPEHPYQPATTSYDYEAALDEAGRPTAKYAMFRNVIGAFTKESLPGVPEAPSAGVLPVCDLAEVAAIAPLYDDGVRASEPLAMERFGAYYGYAAYSTDVDGPFDGDLRVEALHDYAIVLVNGVEQGRMDRRLGDFAVRVRSDAARSALTILVENCGRINYGPDLTGEWKGLQGPVSIAGAPLREWTMRRIACERLPDLRFQVAPPPRSPAFYRGFVGVDDPADTFIDVRDLGKGALWVNGHNAGRFWNVGPQRSLYVPGPWLRPGRNEIVALDLYARERPPKVAGFASPVR